MGRRRIQHQPYLRLTGAGNNFNSRLNGAQGGVSTGASTLDLRVTAAVAKIDTRGIGILEIDHLILKDGGSDASPFIQTTNTALKIHDVTFVGTAAGASAVNDAIILGGTDGAGHGGLLSTSPFQGYGDRHPR
jgi:hypothetical protein